VNEKLRQARLDRSWSQEQAAAQCNVSRTTYIRWEHEGQTPHGYNITEACQAFSMTAYQLGFVKAPSPSGQQLSVRTKEREEVQALSSLSGEDEAAQLVMQRDGVSADTTRPSPLSRIQLDDDQVDLLLSLLRDETMMKTIMKQFDPAKRETLGRLLAAGQKLLAVEVALTGLPFVEPEMWERLSVAHVQPSALNTATLDRFEHLLGESWLLSNQNELEVAEGILSGFLPKILALPVNEGRTAFLASQGLRLQSVLIHHRLKISNKVLICRQAVHHARHANDTNTLVTALIELAAAYKYEGQPEKRVSTLQEALFSSLQASPLVQSRAYSNSATALAESGRIQEAQFYIKLARDVFPDDPTDDPGFALADSSIFTLSYHAGKVYACAGMVAEAFDAFDLYKQHSPRIPIPERIRLEIMNAQSRAAIQAEALERYADFLEGALVGALALGSKKRFDEAITIFQREMPKTWLANPRIKSIAEKYHLERKGER
jgi:transcriptional regulator with XRE-family HTH domain